MNGRRVFEDYDDDPRVVDDWKIKGNSDEWTPCVRGL